MLKLWQQVSQRRISLTVQSGPRGLGAQARRWPRRFGEGVSLRGQLGGAEHLPGGGGTQLCHLRYLKAQHNSLRVLIFLLLQEQSNQISLGNGPC